MINKIVKFNVKPESLVSFKDTLLNNQKKTLQEGGCVEYRVYEDNKNPNLFFTYERYIDKKVFDTHTKQSYVQDIVKLDASIFQEPIEVLNLSETNPTPITLKKANKEDEEFVIFFIFKFKKEFREKLIQRFEIHINETRKEVGNLLFDLYTVDDIEDTLVVYEHWRKESDVWDIHFKQPYAKITGALMSESVIGDLEQYMNFVKEIK